MKKLSLAQRSAPCPFICWQCTARSCQTDESALFRLKRRELSSLQHRSIGYRPVNRRARAFGVSCSTVGVPELAIVSNLTRLQRSEAVEAFTSDSFSTLPPPENVSQIRQRLREWELGQNVDNDSPSTPGETSEQGDVLNNITRTNDGVFRMELEMQETENVTSPIQYNELNDMGNRRGFLVPGDLVELRAVVGQAEELAIFVRDLGNQSQFYTMSGKWIHRSSQSAHFIVPQFVDAKELSKIIPYLPEADVASALQDKLQDFPATVPRHLGKNLILKMLDFLALSDVVYQAASSTLNRAHRLVANPTTFSYASLDQIAEMLLPLTGLEVDKGDHIPPHMLYAVHRSLFKDEIGFRPLTKGSFRAGGHYEISSRKEVGVVEVVRGHVRRHRENEAARVSGKSYRRSELGEFAVAARKVIDTSRRERLFTAYGTILSKEREEDQPSPSQFDDLFRLQSGRFAAFILFIESWAALGSFGHSSSLNGIGSEILRAVQRYGDVNLDTTTAWTFLQEIGVISPWENKLCFDLKLPGTGRRLQAPSPASIPRIQIEDRMKDIRGLGSNLPVYCIDDPGAHEIDDGISIENTEVDDEYWIHIETADPASHIKVDGPTAEHAEFAIANIYLPEQVYTMLPDISVQKYFSLAAGRPSLTFSAKMDKRGNILDTRISLGKVHNVIFLSPNVVETILELPSAKGVECIRTVGQVRPESKESASRSMLEPQQLSSSQKADLQLLYEIGAAHTALLRKRGGVDQNFPLKPKVSVQIPGKGENNVGGTPQIELSTVEDAMSMEVPPNQSNVVQPFMLVAAQVAARWCSERGIPIPYRVTRRNPGKEDPTHFFRRKVLPSRTGNVAAPIEITSEYLRLIGGVLPSVTPGPHHAVGVDMMARCTSPLRRFTDLLVHWQIGAALLEEARSGKSLVGNTNHDFLPFSKNRIEALLPRIDGREKLIQYGQNESDRHWLCLFLLRAWQLKETNLPLLQPFLVKRIDVEQRKIFGTLTDFAARAQCTLPDDFSLEELKVDQMLSVELEHINVYHRKIHVKLAE